MDNDFQLENLKLLIRGLDKFQVNTKGWVESKRELIQYFRQFKHKFLYTSYFNGGSAGHYFIADIPSNKRGML